MADDLHPSEAVRDDRRRRDVQSPWARVLLTSLADAGVRDVVVSPGSRSTPFVLAALDLAEDGRLRCHDVVDERAAAFFGLGRARVTGRPALLLCTSGSAATHYFPAVVEADSDRLPLLILSADRPVELQHCGANQTLDQLHLFGRHVRRFVDLGLADGSADALRSLRRQAAQAVFDTTWPMPGAVHLNARARKPLEPSTDRLTEQADCAEIDQLLDRPIPAAATPRSVPAWRELDLFLRRASSTVGGLIVAGPAHLDQANARDRLRLVASMLRWPIVADSTSQLRDGDSVQAAPALLDTSFAESHAPDIVLQIGRPPSSSAWVRRLKSWVLEGETDHWVLGATGWSDPESTASHLIFGDVDTCLDALYQDLKISFDLPTEGAREFQTAWGRASDLARHAAHELSHESPADNHDDEKLGEATAVRRVVSALPPDVQIVLGNSLVVREVDLWVEGEEFDGRAVLHQRGLSGIDGNVAGAVGAAMGGGPTLLLLGDVSLRHDLGSLELVRRTPGLVIAVLDNGGGRIFEHLPLARHPAATDEVFGHWLQDADVDLEKIADAQGLGYRRLTSGSEITSAVHEAFASGRASLLHLIVDPSSAVEASRALVRRLQSALDEEGLA